MASLAQDSGSTALHCAVRRGDVDVVNLLLQHGSKDDMFDINLRRVAQTTKWRFIRGIARVATQSKISQSSLLKLICWEGGTTPLYYAVKRGDAEIVEILMQHGAKACADPYVENDLGMNAFEICEAFGPFPRIKSALIAQSDGELNE